MNIPVTPNEIYTALTFIRTNIYAALQEFAGLPVDHVGVRLTKEAYERARDVVREIAVHGIDAGGIDDE